MESSQGKNVSSADNHAGKTQYVNSHDTNKAYLFGAYLGDGCCSKFTGHHTFSIVSEDRDVVERTQMIVNRMLQSNYPLTYITPNKTKLYRFRSWNKKLFGMLISESGNKSKIPEFVRSSDLRVISEFVAGLMDTDGYISIGTNKFGQQRFSLGFINSGTWMDDFIALLREIGIKVGKKTLKKKYRSVNEKNCYQININLRSFVEVGLYFNCRRKQRILDLYRSNVRYQSY